ncbi:MAG: hypothetical protein ACRENW_06995, partial [Thermodesulfobacteriota bacterium]
IYTVVEEIVEDAGTPYFCFKDIDENKPTGSIKIRVQTIDYFLSRYREDMVKNNQKKLKLQERLKEIEAKLREELSGGSSHSGGGFVEEQRVAFKNKE